VTDGDDGYMIELKLIWGYALDHILELVMMVVYKKEPVKDEKV
jgi:hypothetical protein